MEPHPSVLDQRVDSSLDYSLLPVRLDEPADFFEDLLRAQLFKAGQGSKRADFHEAWLAFKREVEAGCVFAVGTVSARRCAAEDSQG